MGFSLRGAFENLDWWDKEENARQQAVRTQRTQNKPAPVQTRKSNPVVNNPITRGISRGIDQINPLDNGRTWKQRTPTSSMSGLKQLGNNGLVQGLVESPRAIGEGLAAKYSTDVREANDGLRRSQDMNTQMIARAGQRVRDTNTPQAVRDRYLKSYPSLVENANQTAGQASQRAEQQLKATNPTRMAAATADSLFTAATFGVGTAGAKGVQTAAKAAASKLANPGKIATTTALVRGGGTELAKQSGKTAALSAPSGGMGTYVMNPDATAQEFAKNTALAGAFGAALPIAAVAARPVANAAVKAARPAAKSTTKLVSNTARNVADVASTAPTDQLRLRRQYQEAFDRETNPTRRRQINQGIAQLNNDIRSSSQGGYVKNPLADDTPQMPSYEPTKPTLQDALNGKSTKLPKLPQMRDDAIERVFAENPMSPVRNSTPEPELINVPTPDKRQLPDYSKLTNEDAARPAEFEAVAGAKGTKNARKLMDELVQDERLTESVRKAQLDGNEVNYFAKKDKNGRGVGIEEFDPSIHKIESGFVIDSNGKVLGNHIKVDETGIQVNVGGDIVNMDTIVGNPQDWSGNYKMMETMDRNIKNNAPDEATYRRTRRFLIDHKIKNEAVFKEELVAKRKELGAQSKTVHKAKPSSVSKTEYESDIFDFIEGNLSKTELKAKYGDTAKLITQYRDSTRNLYDDLLTRANDVFAKYGEAQVPRRKDYITHINELMQKPSFAGEMFGQLQNSILGEGNVLNRGGVPSNIAGRTENFAPRKRWNKFFQARQGGEFTKDPFKAVDAYLEPTLYNIHMTESAVRARAVEATFRAAEELKNLDKKAVSQTLADSLDKYKTGSNAKMVIGFQEFANALAGKTQRYDRQIIDSSQASETALRGWQKLQRVGSRATIIGNVQSVLSQTLGQPLAIADAGPTNYLKGIRSSIAMDTPVDSSPFIRARRADTSSPFRTKGQKAIDVGGVPLRKVELAMVEQTWNSQYHKALSSGYKGQKAILEADRMTEQVVGGRGIADMPEAYRSTLGNGFLQYTLEVSAQNKKVWQDLTPKQKITFVTAVFGANTVMGAVTGFEPLPDFMGAALDTYGDFTDETDERNTSQKTVGAAQRLAGETVEMNPLASAAVNGLLTQEQRKNIFGEESSVSRFEGTAAPVQVVRNAASAANNATKGNWTEARNDTLRVTPYGNQARKTITGAETNSRGYGVDSSGNPTFPAPQTPVGKAQTLVFGPSSSADAGIFYDTKQSNIKGKEDLAKLAASDNKAQTVKDIQQRRQEKREDKATGGKFKATGGKFKATVQGEEKDFDTEEKARDAAIRDVFKRTDTQARVYGDTLYYRTKSGAIRTKPVAEAKQTAEKKATKATAKTTKKKSTSRKSGGGARKARKFEFFAYGNPATSVNKSLRQLLDEAMA